MTKTTTRRKNMLPSHTHKATGNGIEKGLNMIGAYIPAGSPQRTAAEIVAAMGGALLVAAAIGVGPTALAGAAGYLAYRETHKRAA